MFTCAQAGDNSADVVNLHRRPDVSWRISHSKQQLLAIKRTVTPSISPQNDLNCRNYEFRTYCAFIGISAEKLHQQVKMSPY